MRNRQYSTVEEVTKNRRVLPKSETQQESGSESIYLDWHGNHVDPHGKTGETNFSQFCSVESLTLKSFHHKSIL